VRSAIRRIEGEFGPTKKKLNDAKKALIDQERSRLAPYKALLDGIDHSILVFDRHERAQRDIEIAKREAEARAVAEEERKREVQELRAAAKLASKPVAKELRTIAKTLKAEPIAPVAVAAVADVDTHGLRRHVTHKAEVVDFRLLVDAVAKGRLPLDLLEPAMPALNKVARQVGEAGEIPGVKIVRVERLQG
jgi:alanyl-tRNA synthetase